MDTAGKSYTILLLSAPIGSGHRLAAEALGESFGQYDNIKVIHGSIFDVLPNALRSFILKSYVYISSEEPWIYKRLYAWGNNRDGSLRLRNYINGFFARALGKYISKINPDAVIATHATPAGIMAAYKKREQGNFYLGAVVTDYTVHRWWLYDGVDCYFIADGELRKEITVKSDVQAFGIPVRNKFIRQNREDCRRRFSWAPDKKICLIMGGGEGMLPMEDIIAGFGGRYPENLHFVAVTGHNEKMRQRLSERFKDEVEIYGFTELVPDLIGGADLIITKAGGLTVSEALAAGLEIIIYSPLPGQETKNAGFLKRHDLASISWTIRELTERITDFCSREASSCNLKKDLPVKADAAQEICQYVLNELSKKYGLDHMGKGNYNGRKSSP